MTTVQHAAVAALLLLGFVSAAAANFEGDGTYYGDNGWAGYCAGNMPNAGKAWPPASYGTRVALNSPQFGPHGTVAPCGRKLMFRGTGSGSGGNPISTSWQPGIVTNLCPECKYGDLDLGVAGDGRWGIEWYWLDDGNSDAASNKVESTSETRAVVPVVKVTKKATPKATKKATPKPTARVLSPAQKKARTSYLFQKAKAIKWLQIYRTTKSAATKRTAAWQRWLANKRAARYYAIYIGRKL